MCHATQIYDVDRELYDIFCKYIGWLDLPKFGQCVPAKQGPKRSVNKPPKSTIATLTPPIKALKLRVGYPIPKKTNLPDSTPSNKEAGELIGSEDDGPKPTVASQLCRVKRARSESPAEELRRAIELLEDAGHLEQRAKAMREEARKIRQRYDEQRHK